MPKDGSHKDWSSRPLPLDDSLELRAALAEANVPTLLMVYVHLTCDEAMLDRFAPHIRPAFSTPPTDIPPGLADELRARLLKVLTRPGAAREGDPAPALMQKMMPIGVGEQVDDEFLPLLLDQIGLGLPKPRRENPTRKMPPAGFKVLVIGAGLSGMVAGIKLGEAGYDYVIIEKNADVGGTWYENSYPGVGVDTPSHFYSFSFAINPDWSHYYPKGREMQDYFLRVADTFGLRRNIQFETKVLSCIYDEGAKLWTIRVQRKGGVEETLTANAVINCHGPVNRWSWPKIPGFDSFAGPKMHTAGWDASVDLKGKKVAVIGTGASSAQLVPAIAPMVDHLTVFMRSKHWVINNPEIGHAVPEPVKWALRYIPHWTKPLPR